LNFRKLRGLNRIIFIAEAETASRWISSYILHYKSKRIGVFAASFLLLHAGSSIILTRLRNTTVKSNLKAFLFSYLEAANHGDILVDVLEVLQLMSIDLIRAYTS
jgi:hypothetical protein